MNHIKIFHYHLNPGGVTRIIESQVISLLETNPSLKISIITGDCENTLYFENLGANVILNKNLGYLIAPEKDHQNIYDQIKEFLENILNKDDIIHFHNLNLGKNPLLTYAIYEYIEKGFKVLNHAHDFAEDRQANIEVLKLVVEKKFGYKLNAFLYRNRNNYLYATLNSYDKKRLIDYGIKPDRITLLPNPVRFNENELDKPKKKIQKLILNQLNLDPNKKIVTYPVRVIRRKNIGEFILLAVLLKDVANWVVTLPPQNPVEIIPYESWKKFCSKNKISVTFEAGTKVNFEELITVSDVCITTSYQEGFGMVYMEPWLLKTPVVGRNLEYITKDLKQSGIEFPMLYNAINVEFENSIQDFANLEPEVQMQIIENVLSDINFKKSILRENSFITNLLNTIDKKTVNKNISIITREYSLNNYAERLERIYQKFAG
ncbi:MAG: glycosyltransferase family 4 protein [Bacteroidales bacterium]|nr:glycosyltransferase family 4 protein [Bacteroidales bacterium]